MERESRRRSTQKAKKPKTSQRERRNSMSFSQEKLSTILHNNGVPLSKTPETVNDLLKATRAMCDTAKGGVKEPINPDKYTRTYAEVVKAIRGELEGHPPPQFMSKPPKQRAGKPPEHANEERVAMPSERGDAEPVPVPATRQHSDTMVDLYKLAALAATRGVNEFLSDYMFSKAETLLNFAVDGRPHLLESPEVRVLSGVLTDARAMRGGAKSAKKRPSAEASPQKHSPPSKFAKTEAGGRAPVPNRPANNAFSASPMARKSLLFEEEAPGVNARAEPSARKRSSADVASPHKHSPPRKVAKTEGGRAPAPKQQAYAPAIAIPRKLSFDDLTPSRAVVPAKEQKPKRDQSDATVLDLTLDSQSQNEDRPPLTPAKVSPSAAGLPTWELSQSAASLRKLNEFVSRYGGAPLRLQDAEKRTPPYHRRSQAEPSGKDFAWDEDERETSPASNYPLDLVDWPDPPAQARVPRVGEVARAGAEAPLPVPAALHSGSLLSLADLVAKKGHTRVTSTGNEQENSPKRRATAEEARALLSQLVLMKESAQGGTKRDSRNVKGSPAVWPAAQATKTRNVNHDTPNRGRAHAPGKDQRAAAATATVATTKTTPVARVTSFSSHEGDATQATEVQPNSEDFSWQAPPHPRGSRF